jgi:hypothetical protein
MRLSSLMHEVRVATLAIGYGCLKLSNPISTLCHKPPTCWVACIIICQSLCSCLRLLLTAGESLVSGLLLSLV